MGRRSGDDSVQRLCEGQRNRNEIACRAVFKKNKADRMYILSLRPGGWLEYIGSDSNACNDIIRSNAASPTMPLQWPVTDAVFRQLEMMASADDHIFRPRLLRSRRKWGFCIDLKTMQHQSTGKPGPNKILQSLHTMNYPSNSVHYSQQTIGFRDTSLRNLSFRF